MISPALCRAARAMLAWNQTELARAAGIGRSTVISYETLGRETQPQHVDAIERALRAAGIDIIADDDGRPAGVRFATRGGRLPHQRDAGSDIRPRHGCGADCA
jgi:transcriptional regulator with XRE-family HTH domain